MTWLPTSCVAQALTIRQPLLSSQAGRLSQSFAFSVELLAGLTGQFRLLLLDAHLPQDLRSVDCIGFTGVSHAHSHKDAALIEDAVLLSLSYLMNLSFNVTTS